MSEWQYFTDDELACKCGDCDGEMKPSFMVRLVKLRAFLDFPFPISSAYRCPDHNAKVGGSKGSYHMKGRAVDIAVTHDQAWQIVAAAKKFGFQGVGISQKGEGRFIHLDNRQQSKMTLFSY